MTTAPGPASPKVQGFYPSTSRRLGAGSFNEDGTFHSITDAFLIQHFGRVRGGDSGMSSIGYVRGNGADVTAF